MVLIEAVQTLFSHEFVRGGLQKCTSRSTRQLPLLVSESNHLPKVGPNQNAVVQKHGCAALFRDHECEPSASMRGAFARISLFQNLCPISNEKEVHAI